MNRHLLVGLTLWTSIATTAWTQDAAAPQAAGTRRALIVCGLAGDAPHRQLFADSTERLYAGLTEHHGFAPANVVVAWGDAPTDKDGPAVKSSRGPATREA